MNILEKMRSLCHCGTCSRFIWCCVVNILFPRVEYLWRLPLFMYGTQDKFLRTGSTAFATVATCSGLITVACKYRVSQKEVVDSELFTPEDYNNIQQHHSTSGPIFVLLCDKLHQFLAISPWKLSILCPLRPLTPNIGMYASISRMYVQQMYRQPNIYFLEGKTGG